MDFQPMSPDEMQRTMRFLIDHQAKFAVGLDKLEEKTQRVDRLYDVFSQHLRRDHGYTDV